MLSAGKISCCILTEINPEVWSRPARQKQDLLTGLLVTKIYKNRAIKISLFNYSMLGYTSPITTSLFHIYRRSSCPAHIFKPTHQTGLQASSIPPRSISDRFTIIWYLCRFLQPGLISSTIFCKKLGFPLSCNHINRYIKLHWAQFPMIRNTYNWKLSKLFIKTFRYNNKVTNEATKRLSKPSNKEMHFTLLI